MYENELTRIHPVRNMAFQDMGREEAGYNVTSVQSYLKTIRKNPEGIRCGGQLKRSLVTKILPSAEYNNTKNTIRLAKSNIRNEDEVCTSLSIDREKDQLINVQHAYEVIVSNCPSANREKINNSNCNIACTKTTAIKPVRISNNIKDIRGMLVSNFNATTSSFNNSSDAKLALSDSPYKTIVLDSLSNLNNNYSSNTNIAQDCNFASSKTINTDRGAKSIIHNFDFSQLSNPVSCRCTELTCPEDVIVMSENDVDGKEVNSIMSENITSGGLCSFSNNNYAISNKVW